ncbi:Clusterin-associated protein 1 [Schistosoma japonicum]|nr:Clusterin-associated protein 1 [Schistosoma japonicum]
MSFREIRLFTEMMRSLGYPRIISLENFRTPNFALVAEILKWLVSRYTSYADLPSCLDSEHDRVLFIKTVTHVIFTNACIRLNSRRLYQADGFAVRELIKVAKILYEAFQSTDGSGDDQNTLNVTELIDADKVKQIQEAKCLCSQLASSGASLNSLLNKEVDIKELRDALLRRQIDGEYVERSLETAKNAISNQIDKIQLSLVNIAADETNLDAKIEKKRDELERNRKRLTTLQSVRPVYMDEYEQLEEKLSSLYTIYLMKFRNLTFLESQYEYLLHNTNQINGDTEITLKTIADHVKTSVGKNDC